MIVQLTPSSTETHEQFFARADRVFANCSYITGSKLERAVFNHLMAKLIECHGYAGISDTMLHTALEDTLRTVQQCSVQYDGWLAFNQDTLGYS